MYLLDTNVVSETRKAGSGKADAQVTTWIAGENAANLYISAITLFEMELGIQQISRRDPAQGVLMRSWLQHHVLPGFQDRVLPVDAAVALRCASLYLPNPLPERDAYIAATALVHGMIVVTRNVRDFLATGVQVMNPWQRQR